MQAPDPNTGAATVELIKIVGALGVAVISIGGAAWKVRVEKEKTGKALERAVEAERKAQLAQENTKAVVRAIPPPYEVEDWITSLKLRSDGSGTLIRECTAIVPRVQAECRIPYRISAPMSGQIGPPKFEPMPKKEPTLMLEPRRKTSQLFEADVVVPAEVAGAKDLAFTITQEITGAFCTTEEQVKKVFENRRFKRETFATTLIVPAKRVVVQVEFPSGYDEVKSRAYATVFYGETDVVNEDEAARLRELNALQVIGHTARLEINGPTRGHKYAIAWMPPPASPISAN